MEEEPRKEETRDAAPSSSNHKQAAKKESSIVLSIAGNYNQSPEHEARYGKGKGGNKKRKSWQ